MKLKKARFCDGCRALEDVYDFCTLGFRMGIKELGTLKIGHIPLEPCPKPRTWDEYVELRRASTRDIRRGEPVKVALEELRKK